MAQIRANFCITALKPHILFRHNAYFLRTRASKYSTVLIDNPFISVFNAKKKITTFTHRYHMLDFSGRLLQLVESS